MVHLYLRFVNPTHRKTTMNQIISQETEQCGDIIRLYQIDDAKVLFFTTNVELKESWNDMILDDTKFTEDEMKKDIVKFWKQKIHLGMTYEELYEEAQVGISKSKYGIQNASRINRIVNFIHYGMDYRKLCDVIISDFQKNASYLYDCIFRWPLMRMLSRTFVYTIFLCDGLFNIKEEKQLSKMRQTAEQKLKAKKATKTFNDTRRFFRILIRLPLDLQMVLINRMFGNARNTIPNIQIDNSIYGLGLAGFFLNE